MVYYNIQKNSYSFMFFSKKCSAKYKKLWYSHYGAQTFYHTVQLKLKTIPEQTFSF